MIDSHLGLKFIWGQIVVQCFGMFINLQCDISMFHVLCLNWCKCNSMNCRAIQQFIIGGINEFWFKLYFECVKWFLLCSLKRHKGITEVFLFEPDFSNSSYRLLNRVCYYSKGISFGGNYASIKCLVFKSKKDKHWLV